MLAAEQVDRYRHDLHLFAFSVLLVRVRDIGGHFGRLRERRFAAG
jgi:hypothetical protein